MSIAPIHLGAQRAQPLQPHCSGNAAGGKQECWSCSSPLALSLVGNFVFQAESQDGKAPTTALEPSVGIPHQDACSSVGWVSVYPCPRLLLHPCEHDTVMPGDKGPSP